MTDSSSYFDFYDCNSSSNSFLKFETSPLSDSPPRVSSPSVASNSSTPNIFDKMDSMSNNNPLLTTASMPIPTNQSRSGISSNTRTMADLSDVVFDFEKSQSPLSAINNDTLNQTALKQNMINYDTIVGSSGGGVAVYDLHNNSYHQATWDEEVSRLLISDNQAMVGGGDKSETFQMDEDDIFQVDKSDLFQEQTMSDLNGDTFYEMLSMEEILSADSNQQYINQINNPMGHFTQLTAVNFQNLQNAINENNSGINECLSPPNVYHTINIPQTPHNTPITSYQSHGGHMLFYDDPTNNSSPSPYDVYTTPNTVTSSLSISTAAHGNTHNTSTTPGQLAAFSPGSHNSSNSTSSVVLNSSLSPPPSLPPHSTFTPSRVRSPRAARSGGQVQHNPKYSTLHSLLMKKDPTAAEKAMLGKLQHASSPPTQLLTPGGNPNRRLNMNGGSIISRLSSSAPTQIGFEQIWQRREPKPHLLSTGSLAEGQPGSTSSLSGLLSPENPDFSQDETFSDEEDSDHYEDLTSGKIHLLISIICYHLLNKFYLLDSDNEDNKDQFKSFNDPNNNQNFKNGFGNPNSKKSRYFWQYNVQAKGPKGQRLVIKTQLEDPHHLNEVTDPVFSPNCSVRGIKVSI